jgi:hypothetical protein
MSTPTAELLADHFVHLQFADIPAKLIDDSTTLTLDYLGVAFAGSQTDRNGVTSALRAQLGFTGAATIFDGERGFCRAFSDHFNLGELTQGLGESFPVFMEYKPYSCARPIHNAIDCALAVRAALKEPLSSVMNGLRYV